MAAHGHTFVIAVIILVNQKNFLQLQKMLTVQYVSRICNLRKFFHCPVQFIRLLQTSCETKRSRFCAVITGPKCLRLRSLRLYGDQVIYGHSQSKYWPRAGDLIWMLRVKGVLLLVPWISWSLRFQARLVNLPRYLPYIEGLLSRIKSLLCSLLSVGRERTS